MKHARSIFSGEANEKVVKRHKNGFKQVSLYYRERKLVGHRSWDERGNVSVEYAIRDNVKHGEFRSYHPNGVISWTTRFVDGKEHGISRQYDENGKLIGTYRMIRGTGVDLWYLQNGQLSEERYVRDGKWNGFERWWNSNDTLWQETHFKDDLEHGIKRSWNQRGKLRRGYPQYYVEGRKVTKRNYLSACDQDPSLPEYRKKDDGRRRMPPKRPATVAKTFTRAPR